MFFFTCKNALLLVLQFYRLFVVISESSKSHKKHQADHAHDDVEQGNVQNSQNGPRTNGKRTVGNGSVHIIELGNLDDSVTELPDGLAHR